MARLVAPPNFVVTGINDTAEGVLFRVQRLQSGTRSVLTPDVRVLHLDQVAIQISRGGAFYVMEPFPPGKGAALYRLEVREKAGGWTVQAGDTPGAAQAVAALPAFPVFGVVRAPFARDAVERRSRPHRLAVV